MLFWMLSAFAGWGLMPSPDEGTAALGEKTQVMLVNLPWEVMFRPDDTRPGARVTDEVLWARVLQHIREGLKLKPGETMDLGATRLALRPYFVAPNVKGQKQPPDWFPKEWKRSGAGVPAWEDEAFLQHHREGIAQLARVVEQHRERVAWVEIGSYGLWGEWHTDGRRALAGSAKARDELARAYLDAFPTDGVPLVAIMDALLPGDVVPPSLSDGGDPNRLVRQRLAGAHRVGLRFDCLGQKDDHGAYADALSAVNPADFPGLWGGEFCGGGGAQYFDATATSNEVSPANIVAVAQGCGWSFIGSAGWDLHGSNHQEVGNLIGVLTGMPAEGVDRSGCKTTVEKSQ